MTVRPPGWRRHPVVSRSAWTLADQAASSASNFVLAISILAVADRMEFAAFSVAITGYLFVTQLTRSAFSLPVLILFSGDGAAVGERAGPALAASVATGAVGAVVLCAAGLAVGPGAALFVMLGCTLPFLQYQDGVRHVAFAGAAPKMAALNDSLWVGIQLAATGVAVVAGRASPTALFLIWAVAGSISGLVFGAVLRASPRISACRRWLGENRQLCARLSIEFVLNYGSYYALSYGLVVVAGSDQLGRWRAAQALIGPISVLLLGGTTLGVPESVRVHDRKASLRKFAVVLSAGLGVTALVGGAVVYTVLPALGPRLFPETWATARPVVPMLTLFAVAVGASTGAVAALRAREQAGWIVRRRAASGVVGLVVGLTLAFRLGAVGALFGLALSEAGFALAAWIRLRRILVAPPR